MPRSLRQRRFGDPLKEATLLALKRVIDPLLGLMAEAGVTVQELNHLVRDGAVRNAHRRIMSETGRANKARVAIITGLPRSEVARILNSIDSLSREYRGHHPARRVLAAWYEDPKFLTVTGEPAILPIFGRRQSFERLVSKHSGGIPVRAMLDELVKVDAVELLPNQMAKAKSRLPILTGLTKSAITAVGDRGRDLMETLTKNVRITSRPLFEATAVVGDADPKMVSIVRREIVEQGSSFINGVNTLLNRSRLKSSPFPPKGNRACRIGVSVYYFQDDDEGPDKLLGGPSTKRRQNLRRKRRTGSNRGDEKIHSGLGTKSDVT